MAIDLDFERSIYRHTQAAAPAAAEDDLFTSFAERVQRRVGEVLGGVRCKWPPSREATTLLQLLRPHCGKERAVPMGTLCERMHITPRQIKDLVQDLRLNFGVQLGASREANAGGYYLVSTEAESIESTEQMFAQAITMLRVVGAMRGGRHAIDQMLTQIRLDLTQDIAAGGAR